MIDTLNYIAIPLVLTIAIEELVSLILGRRGINRVLAVVAVNIGTNPLLNFILYVIRLYITVPRIGFIVTFLEIAVVIIEWRIYVYLFPEDKKGALLYSLFLNATSYLFGLFLL